MSEFKQYQRMAIAEMRPVTEKEVEEYDVNNTIIGDKGLRISITEADKIHGSPMMGDMIARNPKDHTDQWLVTGKYFSENFTALE